MKKHINAFYARGYERFLIVMVVLTLMATPLILLQIDQNTPEWPDTKGVVVAPEVGTVMRWQKRRLDEGPVMRESWYYYFDDRQACFQRRTLGQKEVMADCDSFEDIRPDVLGEMEALYRSARALFEAGGHEPESRDGIEVSRELDKIVFHSRTRTAQAGKERKWVEFNFKRRQFCVQRWLGAQVDSNTYCENFDEADPGLLAQATELYYAEAGDTGR
ncbi:MAG: hypothetical protein EOM26_02430 [Alphaproteobacteria bacterium]|nr:hypothetical protein [Alphaproteobacteria bacterium]